MTRTFHDPLINSIMGQRVIALTVDPLSALVCVSLLLSEVVHVLFSYVKRLSINLILSNLHCFNANEAATPIHKSLTA